MANEMLKTLLKEYEQKRTRIETDMENQKAELYKSIPRLGEIEEELNKCAIKTAKETLQNNKSAIEEFNKHAEELRREKAEILKKEKIDLKPKYECEQCKDTGYILNYDYSKSMCNCLRQKLWDMMYNKSNIAKLNKENFDTFNLNVFSDKKDSSFNISPRENMEYIKNKCMEFVEEFDNPEYNNLLFTGNVGVRKNIYD